MNRRFRVSFCLGAAAQLPYAAFLGAVWACAGGGLAERLEPVGVLGNSGVAGPDLIRVITTEQPSGVYIAPDHTIWIDGGDAILQVTLDGRLLETRPLAPVAEKVNSWSFAALDDTLYFFALTEKTDSLRVGGREFRSRMALLGLPLAPGGQPQLVRPMPEILDWRGGVLGAQPHGGRLLVAQGCMDAEEEEMAVYALNPADGQMAEFLRPGARAIAGLAWDEQRGRLYIGGTWPEAKSPEIATYDSTGKELARTFALQTPANPTQFRGIVSLVGDALWEGAWYGHLGRWSTDLDTAPGTVWTWGLEFNYPCQLVAAMPGASSCDALVMSEQDNQSTYLARWNRAANRFHLAKRIGALAEVCSLAISDEGWVTVGTSGRTLWWKWDDDAADPPRAGNHVAGTVNGYFHEGRMVTLQPGRGESRPVAVTFEPSPGRGMSQPDHGQFTPFAAPAGLARAPGNRALPDDHGWIFATDAAGKGVWRTRVEARRGVPVASQWKRMGGKIQLNRPGDIASLGPGRLAVADGGAVVFLRVEADSLVEYHRVSSWGGRADQAFGDSIRLAAHGSNLLVADTTRHRVLWFDASRRSLAAQAGSTDIAGAGVNEFDCPTAVAIAGTRAIVYDSGNQRIVRLALREP